MKRPRSPEAAGRLFPSELPANAWTGFSPDGIDRPVVGAIIRDGGLFEHGVPLGGLGTGCLHVDPDGGLGEWTIWNNLVNPARALLRAHYGLPVGVPRELGIPFLGIGIGDDVWQLSTRDVVGARRASTVDYWGHYPIADVEYGLDGPIDAGLRAWSPFLPGNADDSKTPGAVFDVRLRNKTDAPHTGVLMFNMPGPANYETLGQAEFHRQTLSGDLNGLVVSTVRPDPVINGAPLHGENMPYSYALGVVGPTQVQAGAALPIVESDSGWDAGSHWVRRDRTLMMAFGLDYTLALQNRVVERDVSVGVSASSSAQAGIILRAADRDNFLLAIHDGQRLLFREVVRGDYGEECGVVDATGLGPQIRIEASVRGGAVSLTVSDGEVAHETTYEVRTLLGPGQVGLAHNGRAPQAFTRFEARRLGGDVLFVDDFRRSLDASAWQNMTGELPHPAADHPGSCVAAEFSLSGQESQTIRFVLAWHAPMWPASSYRNRYSKRFTDAADVAKYLACNHVSILRRIVAWQQAIYDKVDLPAGLRDALINRLYLMTKGSSFIIGPGTHPVRGLLSLLEAAGHVPYHETTLCTWWGHVALASLFPEERFDACRAIASAQADNGRVPFRLGKEDYTVVNPNHEEQYVVNALYYVQMIGQLWHRSGDDGVAQEFYESVKRAVAFEQTLSLYGDRLINLDPEFPFGLPWDGWYWYGHPTYVEGHWLTTLRIAEAMARTCEDAEFASSCRRWAEEGQRSLDAVLWNSQAGSYLMHGLPGRRVESDTLLVAQLEGEYSAWLLGVARPFPMARARAVLETLRTLGVEPFAAGLPCGIRPAGSVDWNGMGHWVWPQCNEYLAALYAYHGDRGTCELLLRKTLDAVSLTHQRSWNFPCAFLGPDGSLPYVDDYSNGLSVWAVAPAIAGQTLREFCSPGGLAHDVVQAARGPSDRRLWRRVLRK